MGGGDQRQKGTCERNEEGRKRDEVRGGEGGEERRGMAPKFGKRSEEKKGMSREGKERTE